MNASNIILNTEAGFDTEIVLNSKYEVSDVVALVSIGGELSLMRAFPKADPSDRLLPESVMDAAVDLARETHGLMKVWAAGTLTVVNSEVFVGRQLVGMRINGEVYLDSLQDIIRSKFH